jgi:hypothetical protein
MPNREFLEKYPLYRKFLMDDLPARLESLPRPAVHMGCLVCGSGQTFNMVNQYYEGYYSDNSPKGKVVRTIYRCTSCDKFERYFLLKFDPEGYYVMKVGQEPPWDISIDRTLKKTLGDRADYYKKGLICESQSYGIGAFAYYRRIIEEIIDELLTEIAGLMAGEEQDRYLEALEQVKKTKVTQDKIALVKDLLPPILRPDGMNPLSVLHDALSQGLHRESDERCIELAMTVREVLEFLVNEVTARKAAAASFTESMRKLLDRRQE